MSNENFKENINQEEAIPTAEVEKFTPAETAPPEAAVGSGEAQPAQGENRTGNFVPFETKTWYYCIRDSWDELFWSLIFLAVWAMYFVAQWFGIGEQKMVGIPYHVLTGFFAAGILYYFFYLYKPFKIFRRKKDGAPDPNANHWFYDLIVFVCFVTSLLVLADRVVMPLTVSKEAKAETEVVQNDKEAEAAKPEEEAAQPEAEAAKPEAEEAKPEEEAAKPEEETAKPEEETAQPEAEAAQPEAEAAKPEAEAAKPEAEAAKPEAEAAKPEAEAADKAESADKTEEKSEKPGFLKMAAGAYRQVIYTVFGVFAIAYFVYLLVELFFARVCTYYRLTPVLFIMKTGFFVTKVRRIAVWDIAQVNINRNLWQRFIRVGTIELKIHSHGMDGTQISDSSLRSNARILYLRGLSDPKGVQDEINHYRLFVRNHMGSRFINTITNDQSAGASDE